MIEERVSILCDQLCCCLFFRWTISGVSDHPESLGIEDITAHHRSRREFSADTTQFRKRAPTVNWRKTVGSISIGASFGVTMANLMDLKIGSQF